jgi:hypothetical protein
MKGLKIAASLITLSLLLYYYIGGHEFYAKFFEEFPDYISWGNTIQILLSMIKSLFEIVLIILFFVSPTPVMRDKAYSLLRYIAVISGFMFFPLTIYWISSYPQKWYTYIVIVVEYSSVVLYLIAKPDNLVRRVNLVDYDMVAFTKGGHRFVHILLDRLFIISYWLILLDVFRVGLDDSAYAAQALFAGSYLYYCFFSEAIFRQTFGKILTGSVVVSNGPDLSTGRVLLRTLARLIPFDALSFLWSGNWHDKTTQTSVVYKDTWEKAFDTPETLPAQ